MSKDFRYEPQNHSDMRVALSIQEDSIPDSQIATEVKQGEQNLLKRGTASNTNKKHKVKGIKAAGVTRNRTLYRGTRCCSVVMSLPIVFS